MDSRIIRSKVNSSNKSKEIWESHDRPRPQGPWRIKERTKNPE